MWLPLGAALPRGAAAGNIEIPTPGEEVWSATYADFEPVGACPACEGPRAFAVYDGVAWLLLSDRLLSTSGARLSLGATGVDLAAGPEGVWVLTERGRYRIEDGALAQAPRNWHGHPLEIAGDGAVLSASGVGDIPLSPELQSAWGAAQGLTLRRAGEGSWEAGLGAAARSLPGADVVDARPFGITPKGEIALALTDSEDGSAVSGVRFVGVSEKRPRKLGGGEWSGGLELRLRRPYAMDPTDGTIWTLMVIDDRLSLRRY